jgi:hypothetical protein
MGGNASIVLSTASSSAGFGYSGSCSAFFVLQLSTAHFAAAGAAFGARAGAASFSGATVVGDEVLAAAGTTTPGFFDGSAACTARTAQRRLSGRSDGGARRGCEADADPLEMAAAAAAVLARAIAERNAAARTV